MAGESNRQAFLVVFAVAVVCAALVSASVVLLRPIQLQNAMLEQSRNVMQLTGLLEDGVPDDETLLALFRSLDARVVDIDAGTFDDTMDPYGFNQRRAASREESSTAVPAEYDVARLGRRSQHAVVYLVWQGDELDRIILPIRGAGMWSMIFGFIALEADLNTLAAATFYEQGETPGLGDRITHADWLSQWVGRRVYDAQGEPAFGIGPGRIEAGSSAAVHRVDALSGATVTADAVAAMMHYWLGPHGFQPLLRNLASSPPQRRHPGEESKP